MAYTCTRAVSNIFHRLTYYFCTRSCQLSLQNHQQTWKKWWRRSPPLSKVVVTSHHRHIQSCAYRQTSRMRRMRHMRWVQHEFEMCANNVWPFNVLIKVKHTFSLFNSELPAVSRCVTYWWRVVLWRHARQARGMIAVTKRPCSRLSFSQLWLRVLGLPVLTELPIGWAHLLHF